MTKRQREIGAGYARIIDDDFASSFDVQCARQNIAHFSAEERAEIWAARHLATIGAKGGSTGTGKAKARTSAQARKAARVRWDKVMDDASRFGTRYDPLTGRQYPDVGE